MQTTNNLNLPAPLVAAIASDDYDNGGADISVTGLLRPPRMAALECQHRNSLTEDASDRIWSLIGRLGHAILERGAKADLVEHRLFMDCNGWKISGQVDILNHHTISDYKFVSVWSIKDGAKEEWEQQLNLYRLLCDANGIEGINRLEICAVLRDWSKLEAKRNRDYPPQGVRMFTLPLWPIDYAQRFLAKRIQAHQEARTALPLCTPVEMWEHSPKWAVMKDGRKSAMRVLDTKTEAELWCVENDLALLVVEGTNTTVTALRSGISIVERKGERVRCASYCAVAPFCKQHQDYLNGGTLPF